MHSCPLNVKMTIDFLPVVAAQLNSVHEGNHFSINYLVNKACMHELGIPDIPLNDETAWGVSKKVKDASTPQG